MFALAGKINNVGLIEVPMGTTLREVIFEIGGGIRNGKKFKGIQTGGPSGGCLSEKHLDTPIDFDNLIAAGSIMGSGAMIVLDEDDCMVSMAKFFLEFTVEESCGKCAPCRIGNKRLHELLGQICDGKGTLEDLDRIDLTARQDSIFVVDKSKVSLKLWPRTKKGDLDLTSGVVCLKHCADFARDWSLRGQTGQVATKNPPETP